MKTIGEVLKLSTSFLEEKRVDRARRISEELLAHALQLKRMDLYLQFDRPVVESELISVREMLKRCSKGEPPAYVIGEVDFFGCQIQVDRHVLIPRPETELLAELVSKRAKKGVLWDLCTGSGCLGIALKKACPELSVTLSDLSPQALGIATANAARNHVQVELLQGDLLTPFAGRKADFIVCNPPYISQAEFAALDPSVSHFEPHIALLGGERGIEFYERLQRELPPFLNPGAQIFLEIGATQGKAVLEIFSAPWCSPKLLQDYAGLNRFLIIEC